MPLVSITLVLPLLGAGVLVALRQTSARSAHAIGLATAGLTMLGAFALTLRGVGPGFSQIEELPWIPSLGSAYRVGVDGISLPLVLLTGVLFLAALVFSVHVHDRAPTYVALFLLLNLMKKKRSSGNVSPDTQAPAANERGR